MRYVAEKDCWMPCPAVQSVRLEELKVLTLNVLFELYGDVETHLQVRMVHIFAELQKSEADVILLQEVTPSFAEMLLQQSWVRDHYWSSCGEQTDSVDPSGQLTLSKWPVRSVLCARLSQHKTVVLTTILASLGRARAVLVANLHLTADLLDASGKPSSRQEQRTEQLKICEEVLHDRLRPGDLGLIAGDFNDAAPVLSGEFVDAWIEANPQEEGYTFDPKVNRVAQQVVAAVGGRREPRRLDRIYVAPGGWQMDVRLVGTEAFYEASIESGKQPWYLSDHFGVLCKIRAAVAAGAEQRVLLRKPADVLQPEVLEALSLGEVELVLLGSAALGIADAGSDVDLLACSASLSQPRFFARAAEALAAVGVEVQCASDATVPLIRFQAKDGREVEVQFMELSAEHILQLRDSHTANAESHAFEALEAQLFVPKESTQVGLAAALDAWALSWQLGGRFELFRPLALAVKRWARKRQLLGTAFGFPGGFAWALMASREVLLSPDDDVQQIQATFFQNAAKKLSDEAPKLWCPAGPQDRNALRSMTRGTAQILRAQLEAAPLGSTGPLEAPRFLVVEMAAVAEAKPKLQRKAIPILLEVERCAQGTAWPLTDVHCSSRGMPCLVMGLQSWTPTAGEQRAMAKSMKTSTGLDVEVRLVSADDLRTEIPSVTE